jgi:hypothetical protein
LISNHDLNILELQQVGIDPVAVNSIIKAKNKNYKQTSELARCGFEPR